MMKISAPTSKQTSISKTPEKPVAATSAAPPIPEATPSYNYPTIEGEIEIVPFTGVGERDIRAKLNEIIE